MKATLIRDGAAIAAMRLSGALLSAAVTIVLGRMMGPDALGGYAFCVAALGIAAIPVSCGWGTLAFRATARADAVGDWREPAGILRESRRWALGLTFLAALGAMLAVNLMPGLLGARSEHPMIAVALLACVLLFDQLSALRAYALRGIGRQALAQAPEMILRPIALIAAFLGASVLLPTTDSLLVALAALCFGALVAAIAGARLLIRHGPAGLIAATATRPAAVRDPAWRRQAMVLAATMGVVVVNSYADIVMLGILGTSQQAGLYRVATQLALFGSLGYTALNMLANQRFAALRAAGRLAELQQAATLLARLAAAGGLVALVVFAAGGGKIIALLFGPAFAGAAQPLAILALGQFVNASFGMASSALMMHDHERQVLRTNVVALGIGIAANAALIPAYGATGAAWANVVSLAVWNCLLWLAARRFTGLDTSAPAFFARC